MIKYCLEHTNWETVLRHGDSILFKLIDQCISFTGNSFFVLLNPTGVLEKSWQFRTSRDNSTRSVNIFLFSFDQWIILLCTEGWNFTSTPRIETYSFVLVYGALKWYPTKLLNHSLIKVHTQKGSMCTEVEDSHAQTENEPVVLQFLNLSDNDTL